jgi:hypothetical protein
MGLIKEKYIFSKVNLFCFVLYLQNVLGSTDARIVTGGTKLTSIQKLYEETGWEKLLERREKHKLILLYKIVNNQAPGYLSIQLWNRLSIEIQVP